MRWALRRASPRVAFRTLLGLADYAAVARFGAYSFYGTVACCFFPFIPMAGSVFNGAWRSVEGGGAADAECAPSDHVSVFFFIVSSRSACYTRLGSPRYCYA